MIFFNVKKQRDGNKRKGQKQKKCEYPFFGIPKRFQLGFQSHTN